ncbi:copper resistance CopC family protein [Antrihabitans cavernicola]|uniref:Copper resistance protein CopC n=1 Tax=Antrihabitans cavernicola TaxID=2495913 RepID=A0A5A7SJ65_9NOCA|nr:copper resistance CopC family protein [Spelaeibacter cavernicola]KAA0024787.1 copper resistance protein CopC [Spelaeibacter cavernicola]
MIRRLLVASIAVLVAALFGVGTASAHSIPVSSSPADGSQIDAGPPKASITFNEALQTSFASLTVVGPDGNLWSKESKPVVDGPTVSVDVGELGPVGKYTIAYRVTSADGHPVSGTRTFTLTKAGTGTPGAKADADASGGDSGIPLWPFIVAAIVLFGGGLAFALRTPRKRG